MTQRPIALRGARHAAAKLKRRDRSSCQIIDAHVHLWDTGRLAYPWLDDFEPLRRPCLAGDYAEAAAAIGPVAGYVHVQADARADLSLAEVTFAEETAADGAVPLLGVVAYAPLETGEAVRAQLGPLTARPLVRGVRRSTQNDPDGLLSSAPFLAGMRAAFDSGLSVDLCVRARQLPETARAARALADTGGVLVLDHAGKPDIRSGDLAAWRRDLAAFARAGNTFCKLSGLLTEADWDSWTAAQVDPAIATILDVFGPSRVLFGSDWPVLTLAAGPRTWFEIADSHLARLDPRERDEVLAGSARRAYRLSPTPAPTEQIGRP